MADTLIDSAAGPARPGEQRFFGVALALVVSNVDLMGEGRVQLRLPWLPGFEPWARVATPSAGRERGFYFIPQVDDEVLIAFHHGDLRDPYVIGSLWNGADGPPRTSPVDPRNTRVVRTPAGHEIELDDLAQSVTIETSTGQKVTLTPDSVELVTAGETAKLLLETSGRVTLSAKLELTLEAPSLKLSGTSVEVKGSATATLDGGGACTVRGGVVKIN